MAANVPLSPAPVIRIPNLSTGRMVDDNGNATDDESTFRQTLITSLQTNFGDEGVVLPTQSYANILTIQNNFESDPITGLPVYTCQYGTMIYNSTDNSIMIAVDNGGVPLFKTVTLT